MVRLALKGVSKRFGDVVALGGVSLEIPAGERIAILGPSGSGKTTLLRLIAGLDSPTSGVVLLDGEQVPTASKASTRVAMVFQNLALFPHLSAFDNIALGLRARNVPKPEIESRVHEIAELLKLENVLRRKVPQLSAGERQRVALGRALVKRPSVLLLDEPLASLDSHLRAELRAEIKRLHGKYGMTTICVTHDLIEAVLLGERVAILNRGMLEQFAPPEELLKNPASPFVKAFFAFPEIPEMAMHVLRMGATRANVEGS